MKHKPLASRVSSSRSLRKAGFIKSLFRLARVGEGFGWLPSAGACSTLLMLRQCHTDDVIKLPVQYSCTGRKEGFILLSELVNTNQSFRWKATTGKMLMMNMAR